MFIFLLFFFMITTIVSAQNENTAPSSPTTNYYTVVNDNSQKTYIEQKLHACCKKAKGNELVECLATLPITDQRNLFAQLSPTRRKEYLTNLTLDNYEKFLKAYSEHDWKNLYNSLSNYEQSHWPSTITEQLIAIEKIKDNAETARNVLGLGGGIALSLITPIGMALPAYEAYHVIRYGTHPIKEIFLNAGFKNYMEATFEI